MDLLNSLTLAIGIFGITVICWPSFNTAVSFVKLELNRELSEHPCGK